jgi:lysophospholipase L1-like esterase
MKTMVCHGDSLTEATEVDPNYTWPALTANRLNLNVINSGIGGDTSAGLLSRFYQDVVRHRPQAVIILGGTNDLWWDLDVNLIQANLFAMACQAEHHRITPLIGLPLPLYMDNVRKQDWMEPVSGYDVLTEKLSQLVRALMKSAEQNDIPCIDFYHIFVDEAANTLGKYFQEDGIHPNKAGHRLMAGTVIDMLRNHFHFA